MAEAGVNHWCSGSTSNLNAKLHMPCSLWAASSPTCDPACCVLRGSLVSDTTACTLAPVGVPALVFANCWNEACQYWWQNLLLSHTFPSHWQPPRALSVLCAFLLRARGQPPPHTATHKLSWCPALSTVPCFIASCYKLFLACKYRVWHK